jgi:hypothetical protein
MCSLVDRTNVLEESVASFLRITLNMEAAGSFETLVLIYQTTKYQIPKDSSPHGHLNKDPKSYMSLSFQFLMNDILICACACVYVSTQPVLEAGMICAGQLQVHLIQNKCHLSYLKNCMLCKKRQLHSWVNDQRIMFISL